LRDVAHLQGCVNAHTLVDLDDDLRPNEALEASFLYLDLVPARKQADKGVQSITAVAATAFLRAEIGQSYLRFNDCPARGVGDGPGDSNRTSIGPRAAGSVKPGM